MIQKLDRTIYGKRKFWTIGGPHLFVSRLINERGPQTSKQIWLEYQRDHEAREKELIKSFTHLKRKIIPYMRQHGKIKSAGYIFSEKKFLGWQLNPERAFSRLHPDILMQLNPLPKISRVDRILKGKEGVSQTERNAEEGRNANSK